MYFSQAMTEQVNKVIKWISNAVFRKQSISTFKNLYYGHKNLLSHIHKNPYVLKILEIVITDCNVLKLGTNRKTRKLHRNSNTFS